jgi:hypothetical protein
VSVSRTPTLPALIRERRSDQPHVNSTNIQRTDQTSTDLSTVHESPPPSSQNRKPRQQHEQNQRPPNRHLRINETEAEAEAEAKVKEEEKQAEERDLKSVIASASHTQLSHILLDLCRHSKTAADLTRSHLVQTAVPVAVPVAAPAAPAAPAIPAIPATSAIQAISAISAIQAIPAVLRVPASRTPNEASKPPKVLRSILKRRKDDIVSYASYASYSSSGESTQNPSRPDDASPSLGRGSATRRPPSVAFSPVTSTASATTSTMSSSSSEISSSKSSSKSDSNSQSKSSSSSSSKGKSKSKSKTGPVPESDSPNSKKRKGPTSALTRCRNCGSEYPNVTPNPSPNGNKSTPSNGGREEEEICVHHSGKFRPIYPPSTVF